MSQLHGQVRRRVRHMRCGQLVLHTCWTIACHAVCALLTGVAALQGKPFSSAPPPAEATAPQQQ